MKWYQASKYSYAIEEYDVIRETGKFLILKNGRTSKQTDNTACFTTKKEAIDWKINHIKNTIQKYESCVKYETERLYGFLESISK